MSLIYDIFLYNGEPIAETRIKYLEKYVDQFILIESTWTFSGKKKSLYSSNFSLKNHPKLKIIIVDEYVEGDAWATESLHRNYPFLFSNILQNEGDCFILCDCDEIPDINTLKIFKNFCNSKECKFLKLKQKFYYYNFNWKKKQEWYHAVVANTSALRTYTSQQLRNFNSNYIESGWHISYALSSEKIKEKIESFSHQEFNLEHFKTYKHIKDCFLVGKDLFNRGIQEDCIWETNNDLPSILQEFNNNIKKLQE